MNPAEIEHCRGRLIFNEETRTAFLNVDNPLVRHGYAIVWDLPPTPEDGLTPADRNVADAIEEALVECATARSRATQLSAIIARLQQDLASELHLGHSSSDLEVGLMCFDRKQRALQMVAGTYPQGDPVYTFRVRRGEGIEGQALRRRTAVWCISQSEEWQHYYVSPPLVAGASDPTTMVMAVPYGYPINSDRVVAVFRLACRSRTNPLLQAIQNDDGARSQIARLVSRCYIKDVLVFASAPRPYRVMVMDGTTDADPEDLLRD